jgi:hypothetical protein
VANGACAGPKLSAAPFAAFSVTPWSTWHTGTGAGSLAAAAGLDRIELEVFMR